MEVPRETLEQQIDRIALYHSVPTTTLHNLVWSESRGSTTVVSKTGDYGVVQLNLEHPPILEQGQLPITEAQALDPEFALDFAARAIKLGKEHAWTACNCYSLVRYKIGSVLPRMASVTPNSLPAVGSVAIFNYRGVKHIAYVERISVEGYHVLEANKTKCLIARRIVARNDPSLVGFWRSSPLP